MDKEEDKIKKYIKNILDNQYKRDSLLFPLLAYLTERYQYCKYRFKFMEEFKLLEQTKSLKGIMSGKNAFVFANGPSFSKLDYTKIKKYQNIGFDIICVNSFIASYDIHGIAPNYYVLSDPAYFTIIKSNNALKERVANDINLIEKFNIPLFVPLSFAQKCKIKTKIYYFNDAQILWKNNNVTNILKPRGYLSMTAYKALAIAGFMGYERIYISGFDNNYILSTRVDKENNIYFDDCHFSSNKSKNLRQYDKKNVQNIADLLYSHSFLFSDLYKFNKNIINLDPESLVDAFSKNHELDVN